MYNMNNTKTVLLTILLASICNNIHSNIVHNEAYNIHSNHDFVHNNIHNNSDYIYSNIAYNTNQKIVLYLCIMCILPGIVMSKKNLL
jgi:hypothetical protein